VLDLIKHVIWWEHKAWIIRGTQTWRPSRPVPPCSEPMTAVGTVQNIIQATTRVAHCTHDPAYTSKTDDLYVAGGCSIFIIVMFVLPSWRGTVAKVCAGIRFAIP